MGARNVRIPRELYDKLGAVADANGTDRAAIVRRALRRARREGMNVVRARSRACTTYGPETGGESIVLRLVDLRGLDEGLSADDLRMVLTACVPDPAELSGRGPDTIQEGGYSWRRDGTLAASPEVER